MTSIILAILLVSVILAGTSPVSDGEGIIHHGGYHLDPEPRSLSSTLSALKFLRDRPNIHHDPTTTTTPVSGGHPAHIDPEEKRLHPDVVRALSSWLEGRPSIHHDPTTFAGVPGTNGGGVHHGGEHRDSEEVSGGHTSHFVPEVVQTKGSFLRDLTTIFGGRPNILFDPTNLAGGGANGGGVRHGGENQYQDSKVSMTRLGQDGHGIYHPPASADKSVIAELYKQVDDYDDSNDDGSDDGGDDADDGNDDDGDDESYGYYGTDDDTYSYAYGDDDGNDDAAGVITFDDDYLNKLFNGDDDDDGSSYYYDENSGGEYSDDETGDDDSIKQGDDTVSSILSLQSFLNSFFTSSPNRFSNRDISNSGNLRGSTITIFFVGKSSSAASPCDLTSVVSPEMSKSSSQVVESVPSPSNIDEEYETDTQIRSKQTVSRPLLLAIGFGLMAFVTLVAILHNCLCNRSLTATKEAADVVASDSIEKPKQQPGKAQAKIADVSVSKLFSVDSVPVQSV
jgi:hypothetical protein